VSATELAANAVTTVKITDLNVTTNKLADLNVTTAKIADANVTLAKLASSSVDSSKIVDGSIAGADLDPAINITTSGTIVSGVNTTRDFKLYPAGVGINKISFAAPVALAADYTLTWPLDDGTPGQVLSTDGSGALSWIASGSGSVTSVTATAPVVSSGGATPVISMAKSTAAVDGYLAAADFTTFNSKLTSALASGSIFVGNAGNVATAVAMSGDVAMTNAGSTTVNAIKGTTISATPTTVGQVLRYDGTNWTPNYVSMQDLRSTVTGATSVTSCAAGQTLTYTSVADNLACTTIAIADSQITYASEAQNTFFAAPTGSAGAPTYRAIASSDLPAGGYDTTYFKNGGNSFGAASSIGNTDNFDLTVKTNNSPRMTIQASGNVGIGTTAPSNTLSLDGAAARTIGMERQPAASAAAGSDLTLQSGGASTGATNLPAGNLVLSTGTSTGNGASNILFKTSYGTGSGTTERAPATVFTIAGSGGWTATSNANGSGGYFNFQNTNAGASASTIFNLNNSGAAVFQVGLTSPANTNVSGLGSIAFLNATTVSGLTFNVGSSSSSANVIRFNTQGVGAANERMRIDNVGNVGIGTTTPTSRLEVAGGAIVSDGQSSSTQCVNFATGNMQVSSYSATNTINIGGLADGGAYTLILTGYAAGTTVTFNGYTDTACSSAIATGVDFSGSSSAVTPTFTTAGNTQVVTFIYSSARGTAYASASTNFYH
jgi:hypothetical protein